MPRSSRRQKKSDSTPKTDVAELLFGAGRKKPKKKKVEKQHWYIGFCKRAAKSFGKGAKKELTEQYKVALAFLGWKLKPEEVNAAPLVPMYYGMALAFVWALLNLVFSGFINVGLKPIVILGTETGRGAIEGGFLLIGHPLSMGIPLFWYLAPFAIAFYAMYYIQSTPMREAEKLRIRSLTFIPEIVNYFVMAMKVTPNLERAIAFVAEHGQGRVAEDFKSLQYDIHVGKYRTVEEALDNLAWKWGDYSPEFKHALMLIRSSVMEADEGKRNDLLDKAITDVLEGIQEKMDFYSRAMHQPSIYLYYFGVLLPLLLIIIIPVGAMMGGGGIAWLAGAIPLAIIYNVMIPAASFLLAKSILGKRPPTRDVPKVPVGMPGLPKPGWFSIGGSQLPVTFVAAAILVGIVAASFLATPILDPMPRVFEPMYDSYCLIGSPTGLCIPYLQYAGILLGIVAAFGFHMWSNHKDRWAMQREIIQMENGFQETLYILASRLGEGRPMEDAMKHAAEFIPNSPATKRIFLPTLHNMRMLGMTIKMALFDEAYGSLRFIPSGFIKGTMRIVVDSLGLGVQTAAKSLISLSLQLRAMQKVEKALKAMLSDITSMMSTMSMFIAPVVLGITIALQQIIMGAMKSMGEAGLGQQSTANVPGMSAFKMPELGGGEALEAAATQAELLFIISFYMVEIVVILMYFASHVNEGDNELAFKMAIAQALPIAMAIFFGVTFMAMKMTAIGI
ncbi:MAG: hypothetical protein KAW41_04465 [Candidatus Diapherotrites archaeon]|nr:hypothetical protein [Candidatus Diapherotrites archaeon]